jgi:hypothetical protein
MGRSETLDTVRCPGCGTLVELTRPPGVPYRLARGPVAAERERVTITVEQTLVHDCVRSLDGTWRIAS